MRYDSAGNKSVDKMDKIKGWIPDQATRGILSDVDDPVP